MRLTSSGIPERQRPLGLRTSVRSTVARMAYAGTGVSGSTRGRRWSSSTSWSMRRLRGRAHHRSTDARSFHTHRGCSRGLRAGSGRFATGWSHAEAVCESSDGPRSRAAGVGAVAGEGGVGCVRQPVPCGPGAFECSSVAPSRRLVLSAGLVRDLLRQLRSLLAFALSGWPSCSRSSLTASPFVAPPGHCGAHVAGKLRVTGAALPAPLGDGTLALAAASRQ